MHKKESLAEPVSEASVTSVFRLLQKLELDRFMLYAHGPDLCRESDLRHAMANCFEALIGETPAGEETERWLRSRVERLWNRLQPDDESLFRSQIHGSPR